MMPRGGDIVRVGPPASVQFREPILFRVIRVLPRETYEGWVWLDGYELNASGDAIERREIFVQVGGLRAIGRAPDPRARNGRVRGVVADRAVNARPEMGNLGMASTVPSRDMRRRR